MFSSFEPNRRTFLATAATLTLSFGGLVPVRAASTAFGAWLRIDSSGAVTVIVSQSEMGQGISTTLPIALIDELGADPKHLRTEWSPFDPAYRHPQYGWMFTGNSESSSTFFPIMRTMGAAAREMLAQAAAARLGVAVESLTIENSVLRDPGSGRTLRFSDVAAEAALLPVPVKPALKPNSALRLIGKPQPRWDIPPKVDGSAIFGIDVRVPDMLVGAVRRSPVPGGTLAGYDAARIRAHRGVAGIVELPDGLCVLAHRYWDARSALAAGNLRFTTPPELALYSTAAQQSEHAVRLTSGPFTTVVARGDARTAVAGAHEISAVYELPAQAHATMEPMSATASAGADRCELWLPTQGMELTHNVAMQITGLRADQIIIHRTFLGGGFGRRLLADFARIAILASQQAKRPVKVIWSREEDFTQDAYRPPMTHAIAAQVGSDGVALTMHHRVVSASQLRYVFPRQLLKAAPPWDRPIDPPIEYDTMSVEGVTEPAYAFAGYLVEQHRATTPLSTSVWRTTGHGPNNFALESFVDELAHDAQADPLAYRLSLASSDTRAVAVLRAVAADAGWNVRRGRDRGIGIALAKAFNGYIAQVVEVAVRGHEVSVIKVWSAVDPGITLDPRIARANVEGGIVWGLSALRTEATFAGGSVVETNFDRFDPLHLWETPQCFTRFVDSGAQIGGTGELGPVPTAAAFGNAVYAATGERIRALPISRHGFRIA